jgi:hypothetical protein
LKRVVLFLVLLAIFLTGCSTKPKPQFKVSQKNYSKKNINKEFVSLPIVKQAQKKYRPQQPQIAKVEKGLAEELVASAPKEIRGKLEDLIAQTLPPSNRSPVLTLYGEQAYFEKVPSVIIFQSWGSKKENYFSYGRLWVFNSNSQELLYASSFKLPKFDD